MRDQEIVSLWEAYSQICEQESATGPRLTDAYDKPPYSDSPKSKATRKGPKMKGVIRREEVEIAAEYFYEMGLNEDGVNILIEDLGLEGFANFVYNIAEEYYLTEARAGGARIEPVTAKGQKFKSGKPTGKSLERLRAQKAARQETENKASASKPSGMKASLERQSAVAAAAKKQPKKPGLLDRVARAVTAGIERHNSAMGELKKMGAATSVTAGKVKKAAGEFKKGFVGEEVEAWVSALVEEGYDLSEYTWDDMCEMYMNLDEGNRGENETGMSNVSKLKRRQKKFAAGIVHPDEAGELEGERQKAHRSGRYVPTRGSGVREGYNTFDAILEHLVSEGYADTNESALVIMANMSEEWRQSIVEGGTGVFVPSRVDDFNNGRDMLKNRYGQDVGPRIPGPSGGGQGGTTPTAGVLKLAKGTSSSKRGVETKNNA